MVISIHMQVLEECARSCSNVGRTGQDLLDRRQHGLLETCLMYFAGTRNPQVT
jgi:hypothetical protein